MNKFWKKYPPVGEIAYEAWNKSLHGNQKDAPKWDDLPPAIQKAWDEAGKAVLSLGMVK